MKRAVKFHLRQLRKEKKSYLKLSKEKEMFELIGTHFNFYPFFRKAFNTIKDCKESAIAEIEYFCVLVGKNELKAYFL